MVVGMYEIAKIQFSTLRELKNDRFAEENYEDRIATVIYVIAWTPHTHCWLATKISRKLDEF